MHSDTDLRRIKFVTRRYAELRGGAVRAFVVPYMLLVLVVELARASVFPRPSALVIAGMFALIVSAVPVAVVVDRWLSRRFGRVRFASSLTRAGGFQLYLLGWWGATHIDKTFALHAGMPSAAFLLAAAVGLWFCLRLWPLSIHYAVPALVALGFALAFRDVVDEATHDVWEKNAYVATLLAWTAAGLIDLMLLIRAMPHSATIEEDTVDADAV